MNDDLTRLMESDFEQTLDSVERVPQEGLATVILKKRSTLSKIN
jgi:hypothetical protein